MMMATIGAAAFLLLWANCALAYTSADQLVKDCTVTATQPEEAFRRTRCLGYVSGVLDAYVVVSSVYPNVNVYCASQAGLTVDAALSALVQWVRIHPDNATLPARSALLFALKERYPCG